MTPGAPDDRFVADVLARTSGSVCDHARRLAGGSIEDPIASAVRPLLDEHLEHCAVCRAVAETISALAVELPSLADVAPNPGFTEQVLAVTSRRARGRKCHDRWIEWWSGATVRPRFAWEVAYALTLVLVLLVGDPVRAWHSATSRIERWSPPTFEWRLPDAPAALARADGLAWPRLYSARDWLEARARADDGKRADEDTPAWTRASNAIAGAASRWRHRVLGWIDELLAAFRPVNTEPADAPARSTDRTETTP